MQVPFVPRQWKPADASLRQVPDTFPVRSSKSRRAPEGEEAGGEVAVKRRRKRRLGPSAWAQGQPLDELKIHMYCMLCCMRIDGLLFNGVAHALPITSLLWCNFGLHSDKSVHLYLME